MVSSFDSFKRRNVATHRMCQDQQSLRAGVFIDQKERRPDLPHLYCSLFLGIRMVN
jgi:hypothetical protein